MRPRYSTQQAETLTFFGGCSLPTSMNARILVADDDADLREIVRLTLQRDGYDVIEAADGEPSNNHSSSTPDPF